MSEAHLLQDLAIVVVIAGVMTLLCHLLRQPVVLGYIIAGFIIGPYTPPFSLVHDLHSIQTLAELGLVFLMFTLGLEFNLPKLRKVGASAALAALLEVLGMVWIGYKLGQLFGWSQKDSIFLGAILSISSTTIIVKVFTDLKMMRENFAQVVFGILILEDIVAVLILSILSGFAFTPSAGASMALWTLLKISLFIIIFLVAGLSLIPRFLDWVVGFQSTEMTGISTLGFCLLGAILAYVVGFSVALGAFLMGAVVAASKSAAQIEEWIHPIRDMFSAIFFVAVGMLIQPQLLWTYKWPILIITLVTLSGKILTVGMGTFLAGYGLKNSVKIGVSMAQIGEFSFVIASLGAANNVTSNFLYPIAVAVSSITTFSTPYLIRKADSLVERIVQTIPLPIQSLLKSYENWFQRLGNQKTESKTKSIFVKYLIRLLIYFAIWVGILLVTQVISRIVSSPSSEHLPFLYLVLWFLCGMTSLPLLMAISKYINHILLILLTIAMESSKILGVININLFYNLLQIFVIFSLGSAYILLASSYVKSDLIVILVAALILVGVLFKSFIIFVKEQIEKHLDDVLGLASSEPMHQAALITGQHANLINDLGEQLALTQNSLGVSKSIRVLRIREQTGATISAIYRMGDLITNPPPDTELLANDILVIWGMPDQRKKAKTLLTGL
ncbi:MAG: hypothetical protein A3I11_00920 [Elusimicrobia bacterium RIFCSPLOWO2_02_FULL_39_32]|nr:MAG: hypothetical protein A3B80_07945 [Elusimicrobia bacterium RIFCSPHIGHO2_02_FULL_39_36]OGR92587.1 MAG: hypothetical protein A3I11_00920 [Elusimicrobia bacterium RIFCSPLOWO2_02_FULL_39_32]OGR99234.1 MAG: hypothetical protein A3G85_06130 [Elusimicrobia bacterium RIFCSPLOWO2_12_FULL_39_28]